MRLVLLGILLAAQSGASAITGIVRDSSGTMVPGATVVAINERTGANTATVVSDEHGTYRTPSLTPGAYRLETALEGFEKVFDALDEILKIVRKSDGKADAADKIMKRFPLDAEQTDAILELKIYRLARLEILVIQKELKAFLIGSINADDKVGGVLDHDSLGLAPDL